MRWWRGRSYFNLVLNCRLHSTSRHPPSGTVRVVSILARLLSWVSKCQLLSRGIRISGVWRILCLSIVKDIGHVFLSRDIGGGVSVWQLNVALRPSAQVVHGARVLQDDGLRPGVVSILRGLCNRLDRILMVDVEICGRKRQR